jgi:hypothetical protein
MQSLHRVAENSEFRPAHTHERHRKLVLGNTGVLMFVKDYYWKPSANQARYCRRPPHQICSARVERRERNTTPATDGVIERKRKTQHPGVRTYDFQSKAVAGLHIDMQSSSFAAAVKFAASRMSVGQHKHALPAQTGEHFLSELSGGPRFPATGRRLNNNERGVRMQKRGDLWNHGSVAVSTPESQSST